ncbi:hypothetical protein HII31_06737 [Pseudocercospora fuligena]|uniref:SnoaL-like domain-containing protein n=1 Tax=Pseudocercospora fuligena TaxID=685502 RepID=A0A8H6RJE2_9PEZI|nr:hypothetical protein HII31_06737 [Pseudocercospora fuligena]
MSIKTARAWAELFIDRKNDEAWKALHSNTVDYFDHAYMIHRIGIEATVGVREVWLQCHDPLQVDVESIELTTNPDTVVAKLIWKGRFAHDLHAVPNGPIAVKASGKRFVTPIFTTFGFDDAGKIKRIDEFYTKNWDDGVEEGEYRKVI